jgi:hypothetical protein
LIPSYQHTWHPLAARFAKGQDRDDLLLTYASLWRGELPKAAVLETSESNALRQARSG